MHQRKLRGIACLLVTFLLAGSLFAFAGDVYAFDPDTDLSDADASFLGEDLYDHSSWSVASAGDVNGDGYDDFLIGACLDDDGGYHAGQSYLILGSAAADWGMDFDLSNADASFWGEDSHDSSGVSVASAGDVNDDGGDDFLIGAYSDEDGGGYTAGQTYLWLGTPPATLEGHVTFPMARVGSLVEPFEVKLFEAGNFSNVIWSGYRTTNNTGFFNINVTPDTYDIGIKSAICVSEVATNITLTAGTNVVDFTIRAGDIDNSDYVDMGDYSAFSTAFNTAPSDGKWNANADLDRSGYIDMGDYSMFSTYFYEIGDAWGHF